MWRIAMWGTAGLLLALPAMAMQFTPEVNWTAADFAVMAAMLGTACGAAELAARASANGAYRLGAGIAIGAAFLTIWVNLAVGMIGSEFNPYNLVFGAVLGIAIVGGILTRFQPAGIARVMAATAIAQASAAALALGADTRGAILSMAFALPWLVSAALFRRASREQTARIA
jgi:hypothetical protein